MAPSMSSEEPQLPSGWSKFMSRKFKQPYFYHADTDTTTWDHPAIYPPILKVITIICNWRCLLMICNRDSCFLQPVRADCLAAMQFMCSLRIFCYTLKHHKGSTFLIYFELNLELTLSCILNTSNRDCSLQYILC